MNARNFLCMTVVLALLWTSVGCETLKGGAPEPGVEAEFIKPAMTTMIPMRDGIELVADVYFPKGEGPFPVLLARSMYGRGDGSHPQPYLANGMAFVVQETRGRGLSGGKDRAFFDGGWGEHQDGADSVAWILKQPWCNGKVGSWGGSGLGITQTMMAPSTTELACQSIIVATCDIYSQMMYNGGVMRKQMAETWFAGQQNLETLEVWKSHPANDAFWAQARLSEVADRVTAPALHTGGWWDIFSQGTIDQFVSRQYHGGEGARGTQKLVMGPWAHGVAWGPQKLGDLALKDNYTFDWDAMEMEFYRHWMLGEENATNESPPVLYYTLGDVDDPDAPGNEWRTAQDWPPLPTHETRYYLHEDKQLSPVLSTLVPGSYEYAFDPADPCPTLGGNNLYLTQGPVDHQALNERADVITLSTAPLEEPFEITGRVRVLLYVSSDAPDTDFSAKLLDIYPDGRQISMLDGVTRLKFHDGFDQARPVEPGTVVPLEIDLWSISLIFNRGHRIGVQLTSSNYPRYEVNPNTGADYPVADVPMSVANNSIHFGPEMPSALILPVVVGE